MRLSINKKEAAMSFLRLAASGKMREAYDTYIAPNFRHHNPYFRGDRESLMIAMEEAQLKNPNKMLEIKRAIEEGNFVAVFSHVKQNPEDRGGAVVHIFRFEDNKVAELWDIGQSIPEESPNENGMF